MPQGSRSEMTHWESTVEVRSRDAEGDLAGDARLPLMVDLAL